MNHSKPAVITVEPLGSNFYIARSSRPGEATMTRLLGALHMMPDALNVERLESGTVQFTMVDAPAPDELAEEIVALMRVQ